MGKSAKIYTRRGDLGKTSLIGGSRVMKNHPRVEAYGTIDELISAIGLVRSCKLVKPDKSFLFSIQKRLSEMSAILASDKIGRLKNTSGVSNDDIELLEKAMDDMNNNLPFLKSFVIPGGHPIEAQIHIARCICRRAERVVIALDQKYQIDKLILSYLNRLSDYLFVLARKISHEHNIPEVS